MRALVLAMAMMSAAPAVSAGVSAAVSSQGCPVACRTVITVRTTSEHEAPSAVFLGIFPERGGEIDWQVGGYWTGSEWIVSATPVAWRLGPLKVGRERVEIAGGLCERIAQSGGEPGVYAVVVGHNLIPDLWSAAREAEDLRASLEHLDEIPEVGTLLEEYERAIADSSAVGTLSALAAQDMMNRGMQQVAARIACGSQ